MESTDLAILDAVKSTRVKRVPKTGRTPWGVTPRDDAAESRAWSLGGNVD